MTKTEIIKNHWPKPSKCSVSNILLMQEAIGKMMDDYVQYFNQEMKMVQKQTSDESVKTKQ